TVLENMRSAAPDLTEAQQRGILGSFLFSGDDVAKPAGVLSGGEKTRLALALLVVPGANGLLLDEPTNNLDPRSTAEILSPPPRCAAPRGRSCWSRTPRAPSTRSAGSGSCCFPTGWRTRGARSWPTWWRWRDRSRRAVSCANPRGRPLRPPARSKLREHQSQH